MTPLALAGLSPYVMARAVVPGIFMFIMFVSGRFAGLFSFDDTQPAALLSALPVFCAFGFFFDTIGAYKAHPVYRAIRWRFFAELYRLRNETVEWDSIARVRIAEHHREKILYSLPSDRRKNMQFEHALWVSLYNVSILSMMLAGISAVSAFGSVVLFNKYLEASIAALVLSLVTLISAKLRNQSYNDKILYLAQGPELNRRPARASPQRKSNNVS